MSQCWLRAAGTDQETQALGPWALASDEDSFLPSEVWDS